MIGSSITIGQKVNWMRTPRGGYGYTIPVAGVVIGFGRKRVKIKVKRVSYSQTFAPIIDEKSVDPESLTPRTNHVQGLDTDTPESEATE